MPSPAPRSGRALRRAASSIHPAQRLLALLAVVASGSAIHACSGSGSADPNGAAQAGGAGGEGDAGSAGSGGSDAAGQGGQVNVGGSSPTDPTSDPTTCEQAEASRSYVGCDFWPTVLDNIVRPDFDYAIIAANAGQEEAEVKVERAGSEIGKVTVAPGSLVKMYLPWVPELKGTTSIGKGCPTDIKTSTVHATQGAYHVTSSRPIALYQFNALEYAGKGGPPGKNWSSCQTATCGLLALKCFSYTNDASLLLPSTALSGTYRVAGAPSWKDPRPTETDPDAGFFYPPYFSVTAVADNTKVTVNLSATAAIAGGAGLPDAGPGGTASFTLNRGDVALLVGKSAAGVDFSGTLVKASAPVQVLTGISCTNMPHDKVACDHLEESVLPAETLGKRYFVTAPSGPAGKMLGHIVRFYGNFDGTQLSYPGSSPAGAPASLDASEFVEIGPVFEDFEVVGDHEFIVGSFQVGAGPISGSQMGDPAQSFSTTVDQYRTKYVFLAPDDYDESYVDVVQPMDAQVSLDGSPSPVAPTALSSGFGVARVKLGPGKGGAHVLTASAPVGIQVMGYGAYTSYQYPGGLNLGVIAPVPIK